MMAIVMLLNKKNQRRIKLETKDLTSKVVDIQKKLNHLLEVSHRYNMILIYLMIQNLNKLRKVMSVFLKMKANPQEILLEKEV